MRAKNLNFSFWRLEGGDSMYQKLIKLTLPALLAFALAPSVSFAVPSFARQTGEDCAACHTSFPELTPFGRDFKLNGYTRGNRKLLPIAAMAQFSMTHAKETSTNGGTYMVRQDEPQFDGASLFIAGKITNNAGAFIQITYEQLDHFRDDGSIGHHTHADNVDVRVIGHQKLFGKDTTFGLDLNNNPTVQDLWNSTSAWGFPFNGSKLAGLGGTAGALTPSFGTMIDGGLAQTVAGVGGYFFWDRHLYGEVSFYGTADSVFRPMSAGAWYNDANNAYVNGRTNPYWRLAWVEDWGAHSLMVGTYGMQVNIYPDATDRNGPTDRYTDVAFDTQYQYISDPHIVTLQATYIHEKQNLRYTYAMEGSANPTNTMNTFKIKTSYLYDRKYGLTLDYFQTSGSADAVLYGNPDTAKPDNRGYIVEVDYNPWTNVRLALQYIAYTKMDGSKYNYDGSGRSAGDNNTLFLNTWFAF
jgi:hypothetical protein